MRARYFVIPALLVVGLLAAAGGVYAYDSGREDTIADGVTIGGVDVGGMNADAAEAKLRAAVVDPLNRPVRVRYKDERFRLTPQRAGISVDVASSVDAAVASSREGNMFVRTWDEVTGAEKSASMDVDVRYNRKAVRSLVKRVQRQVDRAPVDAHLDLEQGDFDAKPSKDGLQVADGRLRRDIQRTLLSTAPEREMVRVRTDTVEPKVETRDLRKKYPVMLKVDQSSYQLTLYKNLKPVKTYGVAVGGGGFSTPTGLHEIQNKAVNPAWSVPTTGWAGSLGGSVVPGGTAANPLKARWLGIADGAGIHGTDNEGSIGSAASHGCVRMRIPEVIELYDEVPVGAPIYIA